MFFVCLVNAVFSRNGRRRLKAQLSKTMSQDLRLTVIIVDDENPAIRSSGLAGRCWFENGIDWGGFADHF